MFLGLTIVKLLMDLEFDGIMCIPQINLSNRLSGA
jgi:hypothetical protein